MRELAGRVAAVTGAGSGIGRALALELARAGARLAISDVDEAGLAATAQAARAVGATAHVARVDVADREAVRAWADAVAAELGAVHLIVNNAGVALRATLSEATDEELAWLFRIDFWGVVHGTRAFFPHLRRAGEGHVVNVSSVLGLIAVPGQGAYSAAKFAVRGFTECLREELELEGAPIGVTCVHPGGVRTEIARRARIGADAALALDGEQAAAEFARRARTSPEAAARAILRGVRRNARRVLIGADAVWIDRMQRWLPTAYQALVVGLARRSALAP
jgi:NAD(P)-dependent dehydrogenase (short-subunit alcohol dehydrogenase family)